MTDEKQKELDRELDTALAKYAAVEPRVGLEERVLASLRAGQAQVPERVWWRWSVAGALAAIIVVALALASRSSRPHAPVIANHHPAPAASVEPSGTRASSSGSAIPRTPVRPPRKAEMAANPRLDQFPSPRALSEQEKLLVRYVREFPEEAVLIAQAQAESEKEIEQLIGNQSAGTNHQQ